MLAGGGDFQSFMGPGDRNFPSNEVNGYQPVSRIGEVTPNLSRSNTIQHDQTQSNNRTIEQSYTQCRCDALTVFFFYLLQVVMNAFIDPYEFSALTNQTLSTEQLHGPLSVQNKDAIAKSKPIEQKPMFHECEL